MDYSRCLAGVAALFLMLFSQSTVSAASKADQVEVSMRKADGLQYVVGKIKIDHPPDQVWVVLANPFEFEQKISPKFKTVQILTDKPDVSVLSCTVDVGFFLPPLKYTVESRYEERRKVIFRSLAGDLKDFRGSWELEPANGGEACIVTYSMFVEPNLPVPQWLVRQAVKCELPHDLEGLRERVNTLTAHRDRPATKKLAATRELVLPR